MDIINEDFSQTSFPNFSAAMFQNNPQTGQPNDLSIPVPWLSFSETQKGIYPMPERQDINPNLITGPK